MGGKTFIQFETGAKKGKRGAYPLFFLYKNKSSQTLGISGKRCSQIKRVTLSNNMVSSLKRLKRGKNTKCE